MQCNTSKDTIIIDSPKDGQYRYRSWDKPNPISAKPDMEVDSGEFEASGTGACRHTDYTFQKGNVTFVVSDDVSCVETAPPDNVSGYVSASINGKEISHYWCKK